MSARRPESSGVREIRVLLQHLNERIDGVEARIRELEARQAAAATALTQTVAPILGHTRPDR